MSESLSLSLKAHKFEYVFKMFQNTEVYKSLNQEDVNDYTNWFIAYHKPNNPQAYVNITMAKLPKDFADFLMNEAREELSPKQYTAVYSYFAEIPTEDIIQLLQSPIPMDIRSIQSSLTMLINNPERKLHMIVGARRYPILIKIHYSKASGFQEANLTIDGSVTTCDGSELELISKYLSYPMLIDLRENGIETLNDFVQKFLGCEYLSINHSVNHAETLAKAQKVQIQKLPYHVEGTYLQMQGRGWWSILVFGEANGSQAIPENKLDKERSYHGENKVDLETMVPLVRVFLMDMKQYVFVHVDDLKPFQWNPNLINELVLPEDIKNLFQVLFTAKDSDIMSDISKVQGNNIIILASGGPGTGKSLTAEIYSHLTKRPVYFMETSEIGADVTKLEENLQKVFQRIAAWNCILLFDEADIFLAQRDQNLERSVMVGLFLRQIERFKGLLFLTSNRPEVIDTAFASRITLHIQYPDLDKASRKLIWENLLFNYANIKLTDRENLDMLADLELNGREIRNKCRLIKIVHNGHPVTCNQLLKTVKSTLIHK